MAKDVARRKKVRPGRSEGIARAKATFTSEKTGKNGAGKVVRPRAVYAADYGLMTAFHHMQRASVVMSLMEEGTGEDLRDLLKRGVKLYGKAVEDRAKNKFVLQAIGVLRAVEHLP